MWKRRNQCQASWRKGRGIEALWKVSGRARMYCECTKEAGGDLLQLYHKIIKKLKKKNK